MGSSQNVKQRLGWRNNVVTDAGNNDLLYFEIIILMMGGKT